MTSSRKGVAEASLKKIPTLKDVAKRAGVSTATVARVLHDDGYVADKTRKRVQDAVRASGYQLNVLAQGLRRQRTLAIGHILHCISPNPFFASVALGVEQEAFAHGYSVLMFNVQGDPSRERKGVETFIRRRVDAIIFTTPIGSENVKLALDAGIPVLQVERPTSVKTHAVLVDNYVGSVAAMEHLIQLGHQRIAFIGGDPAFHPNAASRRVEEQRLAGYRETAKRHGLPIDDALIVLGEYYSLEDSGFAGDGHAYAKRLLDLRPRPTAIFAACDIVAAGVLQAAYENSLRVPDDLSIVGFDDTYAPHLSPPLTTVQQPMLEIGRRAASIVVRLAEGDQDSSHVQTETLATRLVVRASTGPAYLA